MRVYRPYRPAPARLLLPGCWGGGSEGEDMTVAITKPTQLLAGLQGLALPDLHLCHIMALAIVQVGMSAAEFVAAYKPFVLDITY